ncbi:unnamed protein product, partial [Iphiclides podalirius]
MAVRPQHVHDGGIVERRLRPIYDWLDNGVNKKALQEAEKVLKKSPSLQAARALKALALLRLGKKSEAQGVLDSLAEEKPSDDTTLQAMTIFYRESQQLHKVCALYEAAVKAEPGSEELHSHLFMSYVRIADYRAQQRAAMALYKLAPKNPYYFWAVMSIVLQAKSTDDVAKKGILLTLAQRMVDNFIMENKMEAEQEARLYIMILELQEKWEDIIKFIEGPLYSQVVPGSMAQASIPYLKKLGQWRRLNLLCKDLLWDNQDRWDYYMPYFDSVFELIKGADPDAENCNSSVDDTAEKCHEFICQLVESISSGRTLRGPYLARLELWKRLSEGGDPTALLGSGMALCVQYLRVFANKSCSVPDIKPYLSMIPQKEREEHCRDFLTCLGFDENSEPDNAADIQRHISCMCAWRVCSPEAGAEAGAEWARLGRTLSAHYLRCLRGGLVTASATEACAADGYATLAAHHYFHAAMQRQDAAPLEEALGLLELALHHSPANLHVKLLLLALYHVLGAGAAADAAFARLEAKHVQLAALCWLHAARLPAVSPRAAPARLGDALAFYRSHAKDSVEHLTYAYKYGTFEKLVELNAWHARLEACAWAATAARERALLALQQAAPAPPPELPPALPDRLTDNRDLGVIVSWEPPQSRDPDLKARTFERDVALLRLKDLLLGAVALTASAAAAPHDGRPLAQLRQRAAALAEHVRRCTELYRRPERLSLSAPLPSRIFALVQSPVGYGALYEGVLQLAQAACARQASGAGADGGVGVGVDGSVGVGVDAAVGVGAVGEAVASLRALVRAARPHVAPAPAHRLQWRDSLEHLSNFLEFAGVVTFVVGVCHEAVAAAGSRRARKRASQSPDEAETARLLAALAEELAELFAAAEERLRAWPEPEPALGARLSALGLRAEYRCPVADKLRRSREDALRHARDSLAAKRRWLAAPR